MIKRDFRNRILFTVLAACLIDTCAAIVMTRFRFDRPGEPDLIAKSRAILSRLETGREYIADIGAMAAFLRGAVKNIPDGNGPKARKGNILKSMLILASFPLGARRSRENPALNDFGRTAALAGPAWIDRAPRRPPGPRQDAIGRLCRPAVLRPQRRMGRPNPTEILHGRA